MNISIVIRERGSLDTVKEIQWDSGAPLAIPEIGDHAKYGISQYGKVVARSFNYSDGSLTVEIVVDYTREHTPEESAFH
jgi:hypothetical protein